MDREFLSLAGRYAFLFFGLLAIIYLLAELTPKLAAWIDRRRGAKPKPDPALMQVRGIYDGDPPEEKDQIES